MEKKVRIGVIGCGGIANGKHMPAEKRNPASEMVAFCDIIEERAVKAREDFGTPDCAVYTDYKELLKDKSIDAVLVLTPNNAHCEITVAALNAGMSPSVLINCMPTLQVTPTWAPSNIDYHNYGICTLQHATAVSSNTGYVQVAEAIGMDKVIEMAKTVGIDSTINEGLASSLGSSEVSPLDMCEAYSVIASGGVHRNPVAITKIEDRNGNIVYEHEDEPE